MNDGNWHFLVATYDGSGQANGIRLYVDGAAVSTTLFGNGNSLNGLTTSNNVPVTIGSRDTGAVPYDGLLAEAAIFGTVLSAAQVQQLESDTIALSNILPQLAFGIWRELQTAAAFSAIPLYLLAGLAFGNGGLAPLARAKEFLNQSESISRQLKIYQHNRDSQVLYWLA